MTDKLGDGRVEKWKTGYFQQRVGAGKCGIVEREVAAERE